MRTQRKANRKSIDARLRSARLDRDELIRLMMLGLRRVGRLVVWYVFIRSTRGYLSLRNRYPGLKFSRQVGWKTGWAEYRAK